MIILFLSYSKNETILWTICPTPTPETIDESLAHKAQMLYL